MRKAKDIKYLLDPHIEQKHGNRAHFGRLYDWSDDSVRDHFEVNGLYTAMLLPSKALKYIIIALKWKWDD